MEKLIKLSESHYIVVNDSEIKVGDWYINTFATCKVRPQKHSKLRHLINHKKDYRFKYCKKITHSTQPLDKNDFWVIKELKLSEVEEAIYGYSVEKMAAESAFCNGGFIQTEDEYDVGISYYHQGFKAHQELTKDKLFTMEDMINVLKLYKIHIKTNDESKHKWLQEPKEFIQSLLPKTEWDVKFVEGKIKLI